MLISFSFLSPFYTIFNDFAPLLSNLSSKNPFYNLCFVLFVVLFIPHFVLPQNIDFSIPQSPEVPKGTFRDCKQSPRSRASPDFGSSPIQRTAPYNNCARCSFADSISALFFLNYRIASRICASGCAITEESRYIPPSAATIFALSIAASTAATSPVSIR